MNINEYFFDIHETTNCRDFWYFDPPHLLNHDILKWITMDLWPENHKWRRSLTPSALPLARVLLFCKLALFVVYDVAPPPYDNGFVDRISKIMKLITHPLPLSHA